MPVKADHRPLLMRVVARMSEPGLLIEQYLQPGRGERSIHGMWTKDGTRERITLNPMPWTVQTLIHEVLHSLHPGWNERYVENRAQYLFNRLTDLEIQELYRIYKGKVTERGM